MDKNSIGLGVNISISETEVKTFHLPKKKTLTCKWYNCKTLRKAIQKDFQSKYLAAWWK